MSEISHVDWEDVNGWREGGFNKWRGGVQWSLSGRQDVEL